MSFWNSLSLPKCSRHSQQLGHYVFRSPIHIIGPKPFHLAPIFNLPCFNIHKGGGEITGVAEDGVFTHTIFCTLRRRPNFTAHSEEVHPVCWKACSASILSMFLLSTTIYLADLTTAFRTKEEIAAPSLAEVFPDAKSIIAIRSSESAGWAARSEEARQSTAKTSAFFIP